MQQFAGREPAHLSDLVTAVPAASSADVAGLPYDVGVRL